MPKWHRADGIWARCVYGMDYIKALSIQDSISISSFTLALNKVLFLETPSSPANFLGKIY